MLADILKEKSLYGPYLIKIDTQGSELDVLDGFGESLLETEVVVLEVSMYGFMKGAPQFYDVVQYMKQRNFVAYDIILGWNRPLDDALGQVDIVFVKENGIFRESHSYSTIEQLKEITTEILDLEEFYYAEDYHQQYLAKEPAGYCGLGGTGVIPRQL